MNNQENFGRGAAAQGNNNMFPPDVRAQLDPQYQAALEFEELRLRRELELHHDMELSRRLQSLASQQSAEELEYMNNLQSLQNLHNQRSEQHFHDFLAQSIQHQPYTQGDLISSLQDEYLLQRHQQLMMQERIHQRLIAEGLAQVSSQEQFGLENMSNVGLHNNYEAIAEYLKQEALRAASLSTDEALLEQAKITSRAQEFRHKTIGTAAVDLQAGIGAKDIHVSPDIASKFDARTAPVIGNGNAKIKQPSDKVTSANDGRKQKGDTTKRSDFLESSKLLDVDKKSPNFDNTKKAADGDDKKIATKKRKAAYEKTLERSNGSGLPKTKRKRRTNADGKEEKKPKKVIQEMTKAGKLDGRTKMARELKKQVLTQQHNLTDQEKSIVHFLSVCPGLDKKKLSNSSEPNIKGPKDRKRKKNNSRKIKDSESDDDFAANIVLTFKNTDKIPAYEVKMVSLWGKRPFHRHYNPPILDEDYPNLPRLPVEPEYEEPILDPSSKTKVDSLIKAMNLSVLINDEEYASIPVKIGTDTLNVPDLAMQTDPWWPTDAAIEHEQRLLKIASDDKMVFDDARSTVAFTQESLADAKKRLENSVEPGVIEILPHCSLVMNRLNMLDTNCESKFCFEVADMFPTEPMICCSKCSTWRHVKCGGHYKHWLSGNSVPFDSVTDPLCDRCFLEKDILKNAGVHAITRIENQRIGHLRRCNATNAVIRQQAFSKHFQSKWPLGSVLPANFSGHTRSVQTRHKKAEALWEEMISKIDSTKKQRVRDKVRALERLLQSVEDAETNTDIHNMILFLQNDTNKCHPVGFENSRRNIFDPDEDRTITTVNLKVEPTTPDDEVGEDTQKEVDMLLDSDMGPDDESRHKHTENLYCVRDGCQQKTRFDSVFCSDSCGVSSLETDLLHSLKYALVLHPSALRS